VSKKRKEVVKSIEEAVALIKEGQTVAIGGFGADNHPSDRAKSSAPAKSYDRCLSTAGLEIDC
jgi:predicted urease superfamily metal-dependent hydrolase